MKTQIYSLTETLGKTIVYTDDFDDRIFIAFDDDTFIIFYSYEGSDYVNVSDDELTTKPDIWNYGNLFARCFIDKKTHDDWHNQKLARDKEQQDNAKNREIEQLRALKAKYPGV